MILERLTHTQDSDFEIPEQHLCDACGYEPVFSEQAKCEKCVALAEFAKFAVEIEDAFGTISVLSNAVNDALMEVENEIYDNPALNIETEKARIKSEVAEKIKGVLRQFDLET